MRATTAFNRLLRLPGARVIDVSVTAEGVIVEVALRRRRAACSGCGQVVRAVHDRAQRRWRHLDLGASRCFVEHRLRRVRCADCGVRVEAVPWARPGARHTRDFEDLAAFLAQQMAKTPIARLLRVRWDTVGRIVERVVSDHLDARRLEGLVQIGVDEIAYRRGQRYLTTVCDHRTGAIVWMRPGRNAATLQAFFTELSERRQSIRAVSIDMSGGYAKAVREGLPDAEVCIDPFHVCQLAARAVDDVRRSEWNAKGKSKTAGGKWVKGVRWSLLKAPVDLPARRARRGLARQPSPVPGVPAQRAAAAALPLGRSRAGSRAPRRLAWVGFSLEASAVRQAGPHDPPPPRGHPLSDPARALERPARGAQLEGSADQPSQLRLSRRATPDRARLSLLRRARRHAPAGVIFHSNERSTSLLPWTAVGSSAPAKGLGQLGPNADVELPVGVAEVDLDRLLSDEERLGDLAVREAVRRHVGYPALARGK